jgi:hypothetical protein
MAQIVIYVPFTGKELARDVMDEKEFEAEMRWHKMSLWDKVGDWTYRHQYS